MYCFTCQAHEITIYRGFNLISTLLGKIQDAGQDGDNCYVGDVTALHPRYRP